MFSVRKSWVTALVCLVVLSQMAWAGSEGEVAEVVKAWYAAWNSGDGDVLAARFDPKATGFGFRGAKARDSSLYAVGKYRNALKSFLGKMEYYRISVEELQTSLIDGDVGLAWGVHVEDYLIKGQPPELARVRFTMTLKKTEAGWRVLLFHRDMQPFGEDGRYLKEHTIVSAKN